MTRCDPPQDGSGVLIDHHTGLKLVTQPRKEPPRALRHPRLVVAITHNYEHSNHHRSQERANPSKRNNYSRCPHDPKLSSFIQTGGPYANRAAGQGCDRPEGCVTSEDDDPEVAISAQESGIVTSMGASTVVVALAGVGSFVAAVVVGVFIVVGNRDHESRVSERARRFLTWLREEF